MHNLGVWIIMRRKGEPGTNLSAEVTKEDWTFSLHSCGVVCICIIHGDYSDHQRKSVISKESRITVVSLWMVDAQNQEWKQEAKSGGSGSHSPSDKTVEKMDQLLMEGRSPPPASEGRHSAALRLPTPVALGSSWYTPA